MSEAKGTGAKRQRATFKNPKYELSFKEMDASINKLSAENVGNYRCVSAFRQHSPPGIGGISLPKTMDISKSVLKNKMQRLGRNG